MTNKEIYKIWAPSGKKWVDWVRPVPFIAIDNNIKIERHQKPILPCLSVLDDRNTKDMAIIVDLNADLSTEAGILLAQEYGYRPIPIYNGVIETEGSTATSDNHNVIDSLIWGAMVLQNIEIPDDAPPAFLTDRNRLQTYRKDNTIFDNSWDVYHQDLPSGKYLLENGITKILVIGGNKLAKDLRAIFAEYPKGKIDIYWSDGFIEPKLVKIINFPL